MSKVEKITPKTCDDVRQQFETHIVPILKELGLNTTVGRMSYDSTSISVKIDITLDGAKSREEVRQDEDFKHAKLLHKDINFEKVANHKGETWKIVGYSFRSSAYPVIVEVNGNAKRKIKIPLANAKKIFKHDDPLNGILSIPGGEN